MLLITPHSSKRFSVNIWAGIIGPYVIQNGLCGVRCASFLEEMLLLVLEDVPLHVVIAWQLPFSGSHIERVIDLTTSWTEGSDMEFSCLASCPSNVIILDFHVWDA
jgi:hypothetical protein